MNSDVLAALIGAVGTLLGAAVVVGAGAYLGLRFSQRQALNAVVPLVETRSRLYAPLWELSDFGSPDQPKQLAPDERRQLAISFQRWYYTNGAGLLLSDDARRQWSAALARLDDDGSRPQDVRQSMSCLRTRLKQDVLVYDADVDDAECRTETEWIKTASK